MSKQYRSLDRRSSAVIFMASLVIAVSLLQSVAVAFNGDAPQLQVVTGIEEVVVQG